MKYMETREHASCFRLLRILVCPDDRSSFWCAEGVRPWLGHSG
jgi:hypothetical protein